MVQQQEAAYAKTLAESLKAGATAHDSGDAPSFTSTGGGASRSNVLHLAYRPPHAELVLGITDRRFEGTIRSFSDKEGYGFLRCADFEQAWLAKGLPKNDVFLHRNQKGPFDQGDFVSFAVFLNFRGKPQATDLRVASGKPPP